MRKSVKGPTVYGIVREIMKGFTKRAGTPVMVLCLLTFGSVMITGCGGGDGVSTQVVSGVAAVGAPLAGEAKIKDSSNREKTTVIGSDGSYAFDVADMTGPFVLRATGYAEGKAHTLQSFAGNPGTANINPLANAVVAIAAGVTDPAEVYERPDRDRLNKIKTGLSASVAELLDKLKPLLKQYGADKSDPVSDPYKADHTNLDGLFDNVSITLQNGVLTIINKKTGTAVFTGIISDIKNGTFTDSGSNLPDPGAIPGHPADVNAVGGAGQVTLSWTAVGNATSYNIYWSMTSPVTKATGMRIAGVTSPYLHTGLAVNTKYYYIVTAVSSAGEGEASKEVSATTNAALAPIPTLPAAPTGVIATGGTRQTTISWPVVTGATSYNLYWSTAAGVTKATGTKIAGATSPTVKNGLTDSTTYYYILTAVNGAGEGDPSVQVAATTLAATPVPPPPSAPSVPNGVGATGGETRVTISWTAVTGATSYNVYWSAASGVTTSTGTKIAGTTSPYVHTGLSAGTAYYYVVTAVNGAGESPASAQATATTNAPLPTVPSGPAGVTATGGSKQVTISWPVVSGATSYNLYWSTVSGVTIATGTKITGAASPYVQTGLADGTAYYYVVTAVNGAGESPASAQVTATTNAAVPVPPGAPTGVSAAGGANQVTVSWSVVSGATSYNLYWSTVSGVTIATGTKITGAASPYVQTGLADGTAYYYVVTAVNGVGESPASAQATATTNAAVPVPPGAPTGVSAAGGANQVTVSWSAVSGATSYNLFWSTVSGVTIATGTEIAGATQPYVHTGLADGTTYYYVVTAVNGVGESPASAQASATTNAVAPPPPPPAQTWSLHTLYCAGCHGTAKRTSTVAKVRAAITSNRGNMGMLGSANCTSCHGSSKAGQSALTDALIADILAGL